MNRWATTGTVIGKGTDYRWQPLEPSQRLLIMDLHGSILLGESITGDAAVQLVPALGNRHGLVAGATGKTVRMMTLAGGFAHRHAGVHSRRQR